MVSEEISPTSADQCAVTCGNDGECIGFEYAYSTRWKGFTCKYLSEVGALVGASTSGAAVYFKQCTAGDNSQ